MKQKIRIYPKVYRRDNDRDTWKPDTAKERKIYIQEKLDGSNLTFGFHNGKFGIYSRTEEITEDARFAKTDLQEIKDLEPKINEMRTLFSLMTGDKEYKTFLLSGELLGQAKLDYNKKCSGKLEDTFWLFDIQYSEADGLATELRDDDLMKYASFPFVRQTANDLGLNIIPLLGEMTHEEWKSNQDTIYENYIQKGDNVYPSEIDKSVQREGVVVKVDGTGMRYKIVSSAFKEKNGQKAKSDSGNKNISERILDIFATDGRIEKVLQKLQLEGKFDGDRKNKKNYQTMFVDGSVELVEDILEEEIAEITEMLRKDMRRKTSVLIKNFIESDGTVKCACCEEVISMDEIHPEKRTCPKCGLYYKSRKVMNFNSETNENYLIDQVTGETYSAVSGKKHKFKKD